MLADFKNKTYVHRQISNLVNCGFTHKCWNLKSLRDHKIDKLVEINISLNCNDIDISIDKALHKEE